MEPGENSKLCVSKVFIQISNYDQKIKSPSDG